MRRCGALRRVNGLLTGRRCFKLSKVAIVVEDVVVIGQG